MTKKIEIELPVIPREVAEAIRAADDFQTTLAWVYGGDDYNEEYTPVLRSIPISTLFQALAVGYEVNKTPEELAEDKRKDSEAKLRARYEYLCNDTENPYAQSARHEIIYTLDTLGIEIEGVNA
jgi:hypothetical protein